MTEIKSAISIIENEKECVQSDCDRDCSRCELVKEESEIVGAFDLSIRSLQAWEEVLTELEEMKCEYDCTTNEFQRGANVGAKFIRNKVIDIINQKLEGVTENE